MVCVHGQIAGGAGAARDRRNLRAIAQLEPANVEHDAAAIPGVGVLAQAAGEQSARIPGHGVCADRDDLARTDRQIAGRPGAERGRRHARAAAKQLQPPDVQSDAAAGAGAKGIGVDPAAVGDRQTIGDQRHRTGGPSGPGIGGEPTPPDLRDPGSNVEPAATPLIARVVRHQGGILDQEGAAADADRAAAIAARIDGSFTHQRDRGSPVGDQIAAAEPDLAGTAGRRKRDLAGFGADQPLLTAARRAGVAAIDRDVAADERERLANRHLERGPIDQDRRGVAAPRKPNASGRRR